mmetsp:Transcript_139887/g.447381  ORF Transcript_139887/g.447381 Transcript_139887/m.447381 type:complete len:361 (-) Transcript_139887:228-1310(-)
MRPCTEAPPAARATRRCPPRRPGRRPPQMNFRAPAAPPERTDGCLSAPAPPSPRRATTSHRPGASSARPGPAARRRPPTKTSSVLRSPGRRSSLHANNHLCRRRLCLRLRRCRARQDVCRCSWRDAWAAEAAAHRTQAAAVAAHSRPAAAAAHSHPVAVGAVVVAMPATAAEDAVPRWAKQRSQKLKPEARRLCALNLGPAKTPASPAGPAKNPASATCRSQTKSPNFCPTKLDPCPASPSSDCLATSLNASSCSLHPPSSTSDPKTGNCRCLYPLRSGLYPRPSRCPPIPSGRFATRRFRAGHAHPLHWATGVARPSPGARAWRHDPKRRRGLLAEILGYLHRPPSNHCPLPWCLQAPW